MTALIISVLLGIIFSVFATQNTGPVTLNFGKYSLIDIPVYLAVLVPLILGLVTALIFHLIHTVSLNLTINEQENAIDELKHELAEASKSAHKFQLENSRLKSESGKPKDENAI